MVIDRHQDQAYLSSFLYFIYLFLCNIPLFSISFSLGNRFLISFLLSCGGDLLFVKSRVQYI